MKLPFSVARGGASLAVAVSLLLAPVVVAPVTFAQKRPAPKPAPATATPQQTSAPAATERAPAATFDTLLSADAYGVYAELRMLGQQIKSQEMAELLTPLQTVGGAPDELIGFYQFAQANADSLMTARLMFATMPARAGLPEAVVAIEMPSVEEAKKFVPELREFIARIAPEQAPDAAVTNASDSTPATNRRAARARRQRRANSERAPAGSGGGTAVVASKLPAAGAPPFQIKRAGNLIAISPSAFTFKNLQRGTSAALLSEDAGFQTARARFGSDPIFVYFNTARMNDSSRQRQEALEKEYRRQEELASAEAARNGGGANANMNGSTLPEVVGATDAGNMNATVSPSGKVVGSTNANIATTPEDEMPPLPPPTPEATPVPKTEKELEEERQREQSRDFAKSLTQQIFRESRGMSGWPQTIAVGVSLDGDSLIVRGLFVTPSGEPLRPIPFLPVVLSGPAIAAEAPAVLPADMEILVSASLDLPQMYDYLASLMKIADLVAAGADGKGGFNEQLSSFERTNNFRIREEFLAALGNEIAVGMSASTFGLINAPGKVMKRDGPAPPAGPIVVVALNDKEGFQKILPRVLASVGFAGVSEQSLMEKHGDVEVLTFSNGTLAFIDRFLVAAPDAATMRFVTDAYNNGQTLANSAGYRDSVRWQERQAVGQVYVSNSLLKTMFGDVTESIDDIEDEHLRAYLSRLDPEPGAITHLATRDPNGLMHELRLPKNLLSLLAASAAVSEKLAIQRANEATAEWKLRMLHTTQTEFKETKGRYGTYEELKAAGNFEGEYNSLEVNGYEIKMTASGDRFEAAAIPTGYPKQGRRSYFIDHTGVLRGEDAGGRPATADSPQR